MSDDRDKPYKFIEVETVVRFRYRLDAEGDCATGLVDQLDLLTTKDDKIGAAFDAHVDSEDRNPLITDGFDSFLSPSEGDFFAVLSHQHQVFDGDGTPMTEQALREHSARCEQEAFEREDW